MLKRELRITKKGLIIWTSICLLLFSLLMLHISI